jgi:hypothetical protein
MWSEVPKRLTRVCNSPANRLNKRSIERNCHAFGENNSMAEWIESHSIGLIVACLIICAIVLLSVIVYFVPEVDKIITVGCTVTSGSIITKCNRS